MSNLSRGKGLRQVQCSIVFIATLSGIFCFLLYGKNDRVKSPPALLTVSAIAIASVPFIVSIVSKLVLSGPPGKDSRRHISVNISVALQAQKPAAPCKTRTLFYKKRMFFLQLSENPAILKS